VAITHAVRKHRRNKQSPDPGPSPDRRPPRNATNTPPPRDERHVSAADTSHGTFPARHSNGRRGMLDVTPATEVAPTGVEAPPLEQSRRSRLEAPNSSEATPLEFRSGRPTGTPENRKGEQS
jgi:hypothetical protein